MSDVEEFEIDDDLHPIDSAGPVSGNTTEDPRIEWMCTHALWTHFLDTHRDVARMTLEEGLVYPDEWVRDQAARAVEEGVAVAATLRAAAVDVGNTQYEQVGEQYCYVRANGAVVDPPGWMSRLIRPPGVEGWTVESRPVFVVVDPTPNKEGPTDA